MTKTQTDLIMTHKLLWAVVLSYKGFAAAVMLFRECYVKGQLEDVRRVAVPQLYPHYYASQGYICKMNAVEQDVNRPNSFV